MDSTDRRDAKVGANQLSHVDIWDDQATTDYPIIVDEGLSITGCYTGKNRTGMVFIAIDANADGQKFRQVLEEVLSRVVSKQHGVYQP